MRETIIIPGEPVAKGRPRVTRAGHAYTPEKTRLYEAHVRDVWMRKCAHRTSYSQPLRVSVVAYFPVPKSVSKKRRATMEGAPHTKRPDADNIAKSVLDALNNLAFEDDSIIYDLRVKKRYTLEEPRVEMTLEWEEPNGDT
jgi:Holliday junction resolvase RusA-like endonuclease